MTKLQCKQETESTTVYHKNEKIDSGYPAIRVSLGGHHVSPKCKQRKSRFQTFHGQDGRKKRTCQTKDLQNKWFPLLDAIVGKHWCSVDACLTFLFVGKYMFLPWSLTLCAAKLVFLVWLVDLWKCAPSYFPPIWVTRRQSLCMLMLEIATESRTLMQLLALSHRYS